MADKKKGQNTGGGMKPFVIVLAGAALIAVVAVVWSNAQAAFSGAAVSPIEITYADVNELAGMASGIERGDPNAPVIIMEFGDYQCPACAQFATAVKPQIDITYIDEGVARFVFHDFPLVQGHPHAFLAARAARCALDQGDEHYWPYHDKLFQNQPSWSPSPGPPLGAFESYAEQIGLNRGDFEGCLRSDAHAEVVSANMKLGEMLQVTGTPTIFVSSGNSMATRVARWSDFGAFREIIGQMTGEAGN